MREYDMSMEEQVKLLVKKFDSLDKKFDAFDEKFDAIDKRFDAVDKRLDAVDKRFDAVDKRFDAVDKRFDEVDEKFDQVMVRLDETKVIAKLGLEGLEALRESTDAKFEAAAKNNADQMGLLKSVLVHVRQRVDTQERPGARRRKS